MEEEVQEGNSRRKRKRRSRTRQVKGKSRKRRWEKGKGREIRRRFCVRPASSAVCPSRDYSSYLN